MEIRVVQLGVGVVKRKVKVQAPSAIEVQVECASICTGGESPGDQFFVLKYKDRFAAAALWAYAEAVRAYAMEREEMGLRAEYEELMEFAGDVAQEARKANRSGSSVPT